MSITIKNHLFEFVTDEGGIGILTINQKDNPTNLFSRDFIREYIRVAHQAIQDESIVGVIVTSGRSMFIAGSRPCGS